MSLILRSDEARVTTLTLNRPEKLNALNPPMLVELRAHLDAIAQDDSVGCVVLAGTGRSFCAGHDLTTISSGERAPSRYFEPETIDALEALPQPTIAKIRGHCLTGGLELALACDLLVVAASATLGDTHGEWGLVPLWGMSVRLPERVGQSRAKELMFTSRRIDGTIAAAIGLVDRCVADAELDATVTALASEIVANSAGSNRINKALLQSHKGMTHGAALSFERAMPFGRPKDMAERLERFNRPK
jgi:enoyl-CoA hydratase/carnithine racemase